MIMPADRAVLDRVAHVLATHHDHVWGRLPFLAPMAVRVDRERPDHARLTPLITALHDLLFSHLEREDRVLLAIANDERSPDLSARAARLRDEHALARDLLDCIRTRLAAAPTTAGPTERALRSELADLDTHLREQIRIEETVIARARQPGSNAGLASRRR